MIVRGQSDEIDPKIRREAETLFQKLEADSLIERRKAASRLVELGPEVLDVLDEIDREWSDDATEVLKTIRKQLELELSSQAMQSSLVTLHGKMTVEEACRKLAAMTGNRIVGVEGRREQVQLDFEAADFWVALDDLLDQANLTISPYGGGDRGLNVISSGGQRTARSDLATYQGAFRIEPIRCTAVRDFGSPSVDQIRLTLQIAWEPRLVPIGIRAAMADVAILDENGDPIAVRRRDSVLSAAVQAEVPQIEFDIPFERVERDIKKISRLRASVKAVIPGRRETFRFKKLKEREKGESQKIADATVTFRGVQKNVDVYSVGVQLAFSNAKNALESHRGWVFQNEVFLLDPDGKSVKPIGLETVRQAKNDVVINYIFERDPAECTLIYRSPAAIFEMPLEIDLRDIDLP